MGNIFVETLEIEINNQYGKIDYFEDTLYIIAHKALKGKNIHNANISILLCDNEYITSLNNKFRNKNCPTNVLSFPDGESIGGITYLGDIAIAIPKIIEEANEQGKTFKNHLLHMFTHSVLHLLGYDHQTMQEQEEMEKIEDDILCSI
ncbi:MAG: putative rRNA maturation factor [Candidatus Deianiraeaceae bacterium]|jgi:probable rRNA maturation factor